MLFIRFYSNYCRLLKVKKWKKKFRLWSGLCVIGRLSRTMTYHYQAVSSPSTIAHLLNVVCASEHLEKPVVLRRTIPLNIGGIFFVFSCRCMYLTWGLASGCPHLFSLILMYCNTDHWLLLVSQKKLPLTHWLSQVLHVIGTKRRAQVRLIGSLFEP
jgi:hypothetical protein